MQNNYFDIIIYMKKSSFSNETHLILSWLRTPIDTSAQLINQKLLAGHFNWNLIIEQSLHHGVLPLLYHKTAKLRQSNFPKNILSILKISYEATLKRNTIFWKEFCRLHNLLNKIGIRIIPLKGIVLAKTLYPDIGIRPMADIDVLVQKKDLPFVEKQILQLGYRKQLKRLSEDYWKKYQCHFVFYNPDKEIILELHWTFAPPRPNALNITDIWKRSKNQLVGQLEILTLTFEDTLLSICLDLGKNISKLQCLRLRNLYDIHELVIKHGHNLDWDYIIKKIDSWKVKGLFFYLNYLTKKYLTTPWPDEKTREFTFNSRKRKLLILSSPKLKKISRLRAILLIALMLDSFKDRAALILKGISILCEKFFYPPRKNTVGQ
ncbi:nucleotidyltransferase family protein [Candidatus Omnitrophota bacterium]